MMAFVDQKANRICWHRVMIDRIKKILRYQAHEIHNLLWSKNPEDHKTDYEFHDPWGKYDGFEQDAHKQAQPDPQAQVEGEYYANLELPVGSSFQQIKTAYRRLIKQYHPDKFHLNPQKQMIAEEITAKLNTAYSYFEIKYKQTKGRR